MCVATVALSLVMALGAAAGKANLDQLLADVSPDINKWASVVIITEEDGKPTFEWHHYRNSAEAVNFWPASTIKTYAVVAALELLNELHMPTDSVLIFEHKSDGKWVLDAARTMPEMISEVFRRSSNEDYTSLLRFAGVDRINTKFLVPERGFPHSALMRGYVLGRPYEYVRKQPQRITVRSQDGKTVVVEHAWSGTSYSQQRGATVISETTGNCTSTRELAECMRRIMFHEHLPAGDRYRLTDEQVRFIREGEDELVGLENRSAGPYAWKGVADKVFPKARFFHKGGLIETYSLDVAYVEDAESNTRFILAVAAETGKTDTVTEMSRRIAEWIRDQGHTASGESRARVSPGTTSQPH